VLAGASTRSRGEGAGWDSFEIQAGDGKAVAGLGLTAAGDRWGALYSWPVVSTAPLGGTARPNWPGIPDPPDLGISHGYKVGRYVDPPGGAVLLRYDVTGGFEYF